MRTPATNNNLNQTNVYGYETDSLDNIKSRRKVPQQNQNISKQIVAEPFGHSRHNVSRFASALETPALDMTTTEKMRTPRSILIINHCACNEDDDDCYYRGLLRLGVPGEGQHAQDQDQSRLNKNPPGGGSSDFWTNM